MLIKPHAVYTSGARRRLMLLAGSPVGWSVRVFGVMFEDGEVWGVLPFSLPPPPPPPPPPEVSTPGEKMIRKSGGVFAGSAIHRITPETPPLAQAARIKGSVVVEVTLDEEGNVIKARAISGHPLVKDAAVNAAPRVAIQPYLTFRSPRESDRHVDS